MEALPLLDLVSQGQALADSGNVAAAIALYRAWLEHNSGDLAFAAHYNLGALLSGSGQWRAAEASFRAAIASKPWFLESHKALSGVLVQQGRWEDAMGHWYNVIADGSSGPEDAQAVVEAARQELQELLQINTGPFDGQRSMAIHPWSDSATVQQHMASRLALASTGVYWHKMANIVRHAPSAASKWPRARAWGRIFSSMNPWRNGSLIRSNRMVQLSLSSLDLDLEL